MQTQTQLQRNVITLKGSSQIVAEFFQYAVNKSVEQACDALNTLTNLVSTTCSQHSVPARGLP